MQINKKTRLDINEISSCKPRRSNLSFIVMVITVISITLLANYVYNNYAITSNSPVDITDRYVDCVNLGNCEDLTSDNNQNTDIQSSIPESIGILSKLGELTIHKGVYVNNGILKAIDEKFSKDEAVKLKVIMLAECAKDYKIDGKAEYECKSTIQNKNTNGTYDCGYMQINQKTRCTSESFDISYQVEMTYKKLHGIDGEVCGGFKCWSSYKFKDSKVIHSAYNFWNNK